MDFIKINTDLKKREVEGVCKKQLYAREPTRKRNVAFLEGVVHR